MDIMLPTVFRTDQDPIVTRFHLINVRCDNQRPTSVCSRLTTFAALFFRTAYPDVARIRHSWYVDRSRALYPLKPLPRVAVTNAIWFELPCIR
eukprot:scaffold149_cov383-Prasinococcus_capsulatus_cf.AAC.3